MDSFIGTSKSLQMVYGKQFSQPEYVIIFQIAKTYTMSEIDSRKTNTNSSCTGVYSTQSTSIEITIKQKKIVNKLSKT